MKNIIVLQHIKIEDPGYIKDLMLEDKVNIKTIELDEDKENNLIGFDNFTAIQCHIKTIEVLYLSHIAHIRAKYNNINGILKGEWIIP